MKRYLNKQFLKDFKVGGIAIHCETPEQAKRLFQILKKNGFTWCSGEELDENDTKWKEGYGEETCYECNDDGIGYADVDFFYEDYAIIDFKDFAIFDETNPNKDDLMTGMVLVLKNGDISMVLRDTANGDIISGQTWKPFDDLYFYGQRTGNGSGEYDIVEVWQPITNMDFLASSNDGGAVELSTDNCKLLYKYEEPKKMTLAQVEEELGYRIEIVEE